MHELSLATEIVRMVAEQVPQGCVLNGINLSIGYLSGVNPDSLVFCLESVIPGRDPGDVRISVNRIPALLNCLECGSNYTTDDLYEPCPACDSLRRKVLSGRELTVDSIETVEIE